MTQRRMIQQIPDVEGVQDPVARAVLRAVVTNLRALMGTAAADAKAVTVADMKALGFMGEDSEGRTYAKLPRVKQSQAEG